MLFPTKPSNKALQMDPHASRLVTILSFFFLVCFLSLSSQIHTNYAKMAVLAKYPSFFLSKCEQLRKKTNAQTQLLLQAQNPTVPPPTSLS